MPSSKEIRDALAIATEGQYGTMSSGKHLYLLIKALEK